MTIFWNMTNSSSVILLTGQFVISFPLIAIEPDSTFRKPVIASINSLCPFPSIPAIPTISLDEQLSQGLLQQVVDVHREQQGLQLKVPLLLASRLFFCFKIHLTSDH